MGNLKIYKIKKGKHYPQGINFGITFKKKIVFECKFDKSCLYGDLGDGDNYDINKLFGFSTTWFHQIQSGRVGWRCLDGENIELLTYSYNKAKTSITEHDILGVVKPNEWFKCSIEDLENKYKFTFKKSGWKKKEIIKYDFKQKDWFIFHYILFPYVGGNKPAPHDMKISIVKI